MTTTPVLAHYDSFAPAQIETDASDGCLGAVLLQKGPDNQWHPVTFFSKTISPAELAYYTHDQEMLAIIRALEEWRAELKGLQVAERFDIWTDHQSLQYFMTTKVLNARQVRWGEYLSRFRFLILYRPGKANAVADALSRKETIGKPRAEQIMLPRETLEQGTHPDDTDTDADAIESVQEEAEKNVTSLSPVSLSPVVKRVLTANRMCESLQEWREQATEGNEGKWKLEDGLLLYNERLVVPEEGDLRVRLLDEIHRQPSTAHSGREKTRRMLTARDYWPGINR